MTDSPHPHPREPLTRRVHQSKLLASNVGGIAAIAFGVVYWTDASGVLEFGVATMSVVLGLLTLVLPVVVNRRVRHRYRRHLAALAETQQQAQPVSAIRAGAGKCCIAGRVVVLAHAHGDDCDVAVRLSRTITHGRERNSVFQGGNTAFADLMEVRACGRFAVTDDSGVAVVDPEQFEVLTRTPTEPFEEVAASVRQDELVEVIGLGRRARVEDVDELLGEAGYRDGEPTVLLFDGQDDPVIIVARRRD